MKRSILVISPKFIDFISKVAGIGKVESITLSPFIISAKKIPKVTINHETTHVLQQQECSIFCTCLMIAVFFMTLSYIPLLLIPFLWLPFIGPFYLLYGLYVIRGFAKYKSVEKAYERIPFEQEAYFSEIDDKYNENRRTFSWLTYKI